MTIVPESVHKHVAGRSIIVVQGHAVIEAGAVTVLVLVAVLKTVTISFEGDRAVTVVVCPRMVDLSVTVVVMISVREGCRAVTVVVVYKVFVLVVTCAGKRERVPRR